MKLNRGSWLSAFMLLLAFPVAANELTGNVALTSDYVFRGISQTNEDPAIQGGFDFESSVFYAGVWGSNVEFGTAAHVELRGFLGARLEYDSGISWDVGAVGYFYPSEGDSDYSEIYVGGGYKFFSAKYSYADDVVGSGGAGDYLEAAVDFDLGSGFELVLHGGRSTFDDEAGLEDYTDYGVVVAKEIRGFKLSVGYTDTDLDDEPLAEGRAIFTVSRKL
ncbi:MAG: TorF family putative porin [Acidobacteriota bacterium]